MLDSPIHQINHYPVDKSDKYYENQLRYIQQWIEIYSMDSAIHLLNNWDLEAETVGPYPVAYTPRGYSLIRA